MPTEEDKRHKIYMREQSQKGGKYYLKTRATAMAKSALIKRYKLEYNNLIKGYLKDLETSHNLKKMQKGVK